MLQGAYKSQLLPTHRPSGCPILSRSSRPRIVRASSQQQDQSSVSEGPHRPTSQPSTASVSPSSRHRLSWRPASWRSQSPNKEGFALWGIAAAAAGELVHLAVPPPLPCLPLNPFLDACFHMYTCCNPTKAPGTIDAKTRPRQRQICRLLHSSCERLPCRSSGRLVGRFQQPSGPWSAGGNHHHS